MKKHLIIVMLVLSMLATFVGTVSAAPLAAGTATLVSATYQPGFGPVFYFSVKSEFSRGELNGKLHVQGGADYNLYCNQVDAGSVRCISSDKVQGVNVVLAWGGFKFWTYVPAALDFCYHVYDYDMSLAWQNYGTHCQEKPAQYGDALPWHNPDWDDNIDHYFLPELPCAGIYEDAYYFPGCPFE